MSNAKDMEETLLSIWRSRNSHQENSNRWQDLEDQAWSIRNKLSEIDSSKYDVAFFQDLYRYI